MVIKVSVWPYNFILDHIAFLHFDPKTNRLGDRFFTQQRVFTRNTHTIITNISVWPYNCILDPIAFLHFGPQTNRLGDTKTVNGQTEGQKLPLTDTRNIQLYIV
jgi:hypothetical protein